MFSLSRYILGWIANKTKFFEKKTYRLIHWKYCPYLDLVARLTNNISSTCSTPVVWRTNCRSQQLQESQEVHLWVWNPELHFTWQRMARRARNHKSDRRQNLEIQAIILKYLEEGCWSALPITSFPHIKCSLYIRMENMLKNVLQLTKMKHAIEYKYYYAN